MNSKRTALYFTNEEAQIQLIVTQSGFEATEEGSEASQPLYNIIVEDGNTTEISLLQYTGSKLFELFNIEVTPDSFQETIIPSKIITADMVTENEKKAILYDDRMVTPSKLIL